MFSIVRTTTLKALRADQAALQGARQDLAEAKRRASTTGRVADEVKALAERQLRQLAQAHADRLQAERDRDQAREDARQEAQKQLAEIRAEVEQIRRDAADTETGQTMRAALAYRMFQRMYADARAQGLTPKAPVDLVALVLGLDEDTGTQEPAPVVDPWAATTADH